MVEGIGWERAVISLPEDMREVAYDASTGTLTIGDGRVGGVRREVWDYAVSGMQIVPKWLGYRTRSGTGRAVQSKSGLDKIRPTGWADAWNDELLDLLRVLTLTVDRHAVLADLLQRICSGALLPAVMVPKPGDGQRLPPPTAR